MVREIHDGAAGSHSFDTEVMSPLIDMDSPEERKAA